MELIVEFIFVKGTQIKVSDVVKAYFCKVLDTKEKKDFVTYKVAVDIIDLKLLDNKFKLLDLDLNQYKGYTEVIGIKDIVAFK